MKTIKAYKITYEETIIKRPRNLANLGQPDNPKSPVEARKGPSSKTGGRNFLKTALKNTTNQATNQNAPEQPQTGIFPSQSPPSNTETPNPQDVDPYDSDSVQNLESLPPTDPLPQDPPEIQDSNFEGEALRIIMPKIELEDQTLWATQTSMIAHKNELRKTIKENGNTEKILDVVKALNRKKFKYLAEDINVSVAVHKQKRMASMIKIEKQFKKLVDGSKVESTALFMKKKKCDKGKWELGRLSAVDDKLERLG